MPDEPPLLRKLEELEASRQNKPGGDTFMGVGICIIGLAVIFGNLRPAPGSSPLLLQLIGVFIVCFGLFWAFQGQRMPRASTAAFSIAALILVAITNWGAFGPGPRVCFRGRASIPMSEADCRFWLGVFALFLDAILLLILVALAARKK